MNKHGITSPPSMKDQAIYRIRVAGRLSASYSGQLEGMNITETSFNDGENQTVLVGRLSDQAALYGVLGTLYELRLPIVSVDFMERG